MANAANLINFGSGGGGALAVGDWTYSAYPLSAPAYLPLNDDTASYLKSSYATLGNLFGTTATTFAATTRTPTFDLQSTLPKTVFGNGGFVSIVPLVTRPPLYSKDGITFNFGSYPSTSPTGNRYFTGALAYGNGKFVAGWYDQPIGYSSAVSTDNGLTWSSGGQVTVGGNSIVPNAMAYGNGVFVAGNYGDGVNPTVIYYSYDGKYWINSNNGAITRDISGVAFGAGTFVVVASGLNTVSQYTTNQSAYSTDNGVNWTLTTLPATQSWNSIAYGNGVFVAVGQQAAQGSTAGVTVAATSPTGATWTSRTLPTSQSWTSVTFANGYFMAVGNTFNNVANTTIATSTDGITWVSQTVSSATARRGVAGGNGIFVYNQLAKGITTINLATTSTTFNLPIITTAPSGTAPYIKAT